MHLFIKKKYMCREHQCNFFHIYHQRHKMIVVIFQYKLLLGIYVKKGE